MKNKIFYFGINTVIFSNSNYADILFTRNLFVYHKKIIVLANFQQFYLNEKKKKKKNIRIKKLTVFTHLKLFYTCIYSDIYTIIETWIIVGNVSCNLHNV